MMKRHILFITVLCLVSAMVLPEASQAQTRVSIQGTEINCPQDPTPCPIAGTNYTGFTISDYNGTAQVRFVDSTQDLLILEHALIKATGAITNSDITFWRNFLEGPNAPTPQALVRFQRQGKGTLRRGAGAAAPPAPGNAVTVTGFVKGDEIAVSQTKTVPPNPPCSATTCGDFNLTKTEDWYTLSGTREMKGEFWFSLAQANDELRVDLVQVQTIQAGMEEDPVKMGVTEDCAPTKGKKLREGCPR